MTPEVLAFLSRVPPRTSVIEVGALNVNGSARTAIKHKHWLGTDLRPGEGVDMVCDGANLSHYFGPIFDGGVAAECLEHCENWRAVLYALYACVKPGGIMAITTPGPTPMFPRHDYPSDFWRFSCTHWRTIFARCTIIDTIDIFYPHNGTGVIVAKTGPMNLEVEPIPAPVS